MKYYTKEWWGGAGDPAAAVNAYWSYIGSIRSSLPMELARLLEEVSLHDSRVESFTVTSQDSLAVLILNGSSDPWCRSKEGDHPRRFTLRYAGVTDVSMRNGDGVRVTELDDSDLGYDEMELLPCGLIQHRMLFASDIELHLTFKDFSLEFNDMDADVTRAELHSADPDQRRIAIMRASRTSDASQLSALLELLDTDTYENRRHIVRALGNIGGADSEAKLLTLLTMESGLILGDISKSLGLLKTRAAIPRLTQLLAHSVDWINSSAKWALKQMDADAK